jgi:hypothetical protein
MDRMGIKKKLLKELMGTMGDDELMKHPNAPSMVISIGIAPKKSGEESEEGEGMPEMGGYPETEEDEDMEQEDLDPRLKDILRRKMNLRK